MTEITQEGWKNKALSMLLAQLTSYVLFIAATVIPSPGTVPIIPLIIAALTLAAFVVFWPFRGSILDRIVTLVFGAISLIFVIVPFPTSEVPPDQTAADGSVLPWYSWARPWACCWWCWWSSPSDARWLVRSANILSAHSLTP